MSGPLMLIALFAIGAALGWWLKGRTAQTRRLVFLGTLFLLGAPILVWAFAALIGSESLGLLAGFSLMGLIAVVLPVWLGSLVGGRFARSSHEPDTAPAPRFPGTACCEHIAPIEHAMRAAGVQMELDPPRSASANCILDREALARRFPQMGGVVYQEWYSRDEVGQLPLTLLYCYTCPSKLWVVHPQKAAPGTPTFPGAASAVDPFDVLFAGLDKLGPGDDTHTRYVLQLLPHRKFRTVVDAGCGTGRQTLVLARELDTVIHAVDSRASFLEQLSQRARMANLERRVQTHCMDMKDIPTVFQDIELLWSEGAAYSIGFANAFSTWARAIVPGGLVVASELSWLQDPASDAVREFFRTGYPDMQSIEQNIAAIEQAGYRVLTTHKLPSQAWIDGYYDALEPRARQMLDHPDAAVRALSAETLQEIEIFQRSGESYGYVFYVAQRA
jgi:cyclopropane fatty-acyl-phospholipid synthase-like methyltransferase